MSPFMELRYHRSQKGYTLIEAMVVIGVVAIASAVAIPLMTKSRDDARLRGTARETIGKLQLARAMSVNARRTGDGVFRGGGGGPEGNGQGDPSRSGEGIEGNPLSAPASPSSNPFENPTSSRDPISPPQAAPAMGASAISEVVVASEVRFMTRTQIELWQIGDQGGQQLMQVIDLRASDPTSPIEVAAPAPGSRIRFKNGIKDPSSPSQIDIIDQRTGKISVIDVGVSGMRIRI